MPNPISPGPASKTDAAQDRSAFPAPSIDVGGPLDIDSLSAEDIKAQLTARERDLKYHVAALRHEVMTLGEDINVAGRPLLDVLRSNLVPSVAAAASLGLVGGLLLGLRAQRRSRPEPNDELDFVRARMATLIDEAAWHVARGIAPDDALRRTLKTTPIVFAERKPAARPKEASTGVMSTAVNSALGFLLKTVMDQVTKKLTGHEETFSAIEDAASDG